jgi:hypothetical protein
MLNLRRRYPIICPNSSILNNSLEMTRILKSQEELYVEEGLFYEGFLSY